MAVDSRYGSLWGGWCSLELGGAYGVGLWKNIKKGWDNFRGFTRNVVGNGTKISFWHDLCGNLVLKLAFLVLYGIACEKNALVADDLEVLGGSNQWNVSFTREANDWSWKSLHRFYRCCIQPQ